MCTMVRNIPLTLKISPSRLLDVKLSAMPSAKQNLSLLEPIMDVSITIPEAMMGDIMSDLNTRRGRVQGMDTVGIKEYRDGRSSAIGDVALWE